MFRTTPALVLREVRYNEADRLLTLLTKTDGLITASARGALRRGSRMSAATQQLTYSDMTIFGNKGKWIINEAAIIEPFGGLREDISAYSLGTYFAAAVEALSVEDQPDDAMLQLILNSLYALSNELHRHEHIKASFELRLMCLAGYAPELSKCCICGQEPDEPMFSVSTGQILCRKCREPSLGRTKPLCAESLAAMRHICTAPPKKFMSFSASDDAVKRLAEVSETYLLDKTERDFRQLQYYKDINRLR